MNTNPNRNLWPSPTCSARLALGWWATAVAFAVCLAPTSRSSTLDVGVAFRDITPEPPIWLAGYAARNRPADRIDQPLVLQALAFRDEAGKRCVLVAADNCEISAPFAAPALTRIEAEHGLKPGEVIIVSSHSHSTPVLEGPLSGMYPLGPTDTERISAYGQTLRDRLAEAVGAALADLALARLEYGVGRCNFAMNRRAFTAQDVVIGENPDGPVDHDVPVLRVTGTNGVLRAIVFGYACHATSIQGDDFYTVSPDFPGYARAHLEALYPGAVVIFLTGMGADANPAPRGSLLDSKRHGLELAGAVAGVLSRPMRPVTGVMQFAYTDVALPLEPPPAREQIEQDAQSQNQDIRHRALEYLRRLDGGHPAPGVTLPMSVLGLGDRLALVFMGGEVVVDYARRFKRVFADMHPWTVGYAYDVPCYIPSARVVKEGGYEADSSMIYYNLYGPFKPAVEEVVLKQMNKLMSGLSHRGFAAKP